jgi:hypothetical protein
MTLQIPQLLGLAAQAGFSGADLATAVAVALAESSGNPEAYNPERAAGAPEGQGSFGLWQIYLHAHPEFSGQNLFDPQTNAAAAYAVYAAAGNSFHPWSTFVSGAYLAQLEAVNQVLAASPDSTAGGGFPTTDLVTALVVGGIVVYFTGRLLGW